MSLVMCSSMRNFFPFASLNTNIQSPSDLADQWAPLTLSILSNSQTPSISQNQIDQSSNLPSPSTPTSPTTFSTPHNPQSPILEIDSYTSSSPTQSNHTPTPTHPSNISSPSP